MSSPPPIFHDDVRHTTQIGARAQSFVGDHVDEAGIKRLQKITHLTFASGGSIRDCGIRPTHHYAIVSSNMLRSSKGYEQYMNLVWTIDENIEILTRTFVQEDMMRILSGDLSKDMVAKLCDVLFNILYPAYEKSVAR